ncbi:fimbrillin family protein [Proteiniphilum sp.]|uniref:fimbrillin family protein n=1 Tax=Proteiniphilum sp. TaxID=1926877 RepID=UPI00331A915D
MKKFLFIGLVATAMLVSCNNDETVEFAKGSAIQFDTFVNKSVRGATDDITTANISNFSVYGFMENAGGQIFTSEAVTGSSDTWTYANTQYWTAGKKYYFSAIAPTTSAQWTYDVNSKVEGGIITFTNGTGTQDLLYAYSGEITTPDPITAAPDKVGFTFSHLLSRVKFNFSNAMDNASTTLTVTEVKITDANGKATCDVSAATKTWTLAADNAAATLEFGPVLATDAKVTTTASSATDHKYMIPQNQAYKLSFKVEMYQGTVLAATYNHVDVVVPAVEMLPGNSYVFNAELNPENINPEEELYPIEFTVTTVTDWADFTDGGDLTGFEDTTPVTP